jgi:prevent-host-death family protein
MRIVVGDLVAGGGRVNPIGNAEEMRPKLSQGDRHGSILLCFTFRNQRSLAQIAWGSKAATQRRGKPRITRMTRIGNGLTQVTLFPVDLCPCYVHLVVMKTETVNVAALKQNLSAYLRLVERGDEVLVTSHRRAVARLVSENDTCTVVRAPTLPLRALRKIRGVKLPKSFSAVQTLLNDRSRR